MLTLKVASASMQNMKKSVKFAETPDQIGCLWSVFLSMIPPSWGGIRLEMANVSYGQPFVKRFVERCLLL